MKKKYFVATLVIGVIVTFYIGNGFYNRSTNPNLVDPIKNIETNEALFSSLKDSSLGEDEKISNREGVNQYDALKNISIEDINKKNNSLGGGITDEEIRISALEEISSNASFESNLMKEIGFSQQGSDAITESNPKSLLSLEHMPTMLRDALKEELEKSKRNGFDEVSEVDADKITGIMNYIIGSDNTAPNITFSMSNLPGSVIRNYEYIGYTFPNYPTVSDTTVKSDTIRRVFERHDASSFLIIEESSLASGGATLIREFVNTNVGGLPGIYSIKKSETGKTYAMLNWITSNFAYTLYQVGSLDSANEILSFVGSELTQINYKEDSSSDNGDMPEDEGIPSQAQ